MDPLLEMAKYCVENLMTEHTALVAAVEAFLDADNS